MDSRILAIVFVVIICAILNHDSTTEGLTTTSSTRMDGSSEGTYGTTASLNEVTSSTVQHSRKTKLKPREEEETNISPSIPKSNAALLLLLGFGGFSILVAAAYKSLRKYVYHEEHNLHTVFDAVRPWRNSLIFDWHNCGHIAFSCFVHLFEDKGSFLIVCTSMLLAGKSALEVLTKDVNSEFIFRVLAFLFGSYCMIGGLGTTFYISYFNTAMTFLSVTVYVLYTSYFPSEESKEYSSMETLYTAAICVEAPETNYQQSHTTFRTESGLVYGVVLLFMATSASFTNQANWQSRIAAKPTNGILGFFMAAYLWCVIAPCLSVTVTASYFAMSLKNGTHLLSESEIDNGE
ncbi:DUR31-like protein [Mya arenaria]|uniref:DUR31-like protein n=1 Tax=Mya arenaria TaxID=6604 RepID=A0ABY7DNN9_MYAAR|nr:DUR31-like protein [Mya arenaria]